MGPVVPGKPIIDVLDSSALTLGCGICSSCWFVYSLLSSPPNIFILVPNVAGLGLFVIQITVYR